MKVTLMIFLGIVAAIGVLGSNFVDSDAKTGWMLAGLVAAVIDVTLVAMDKMNNPQN